MSRPLQILHDNHNGSQESVKDIYNRMPLILKPEDYDAWLDPDNLEIARIERLLETACLKELKRYPVSRLVNQVGNNKKGCMQPLKDAIE